MQMQRQEERQNEDASRRANLLARSSVQVLPQTSLLSALHVWSIFEYQPCRHSAHQSFFCLVQPAYAAVSIAILFTSGSSCAPSPAQPICNNADSRFVTSHASPAVQLPIGLEKLLFI